MTNKQTDLENRYLGRHCFKTVGSNVIHTGQIKEVRYKDSWAEGKVFWLTKEGVSVADREQNSWEKIPNLGFHDLPATDKADKTAAEPSTDLTPFSNWTADADCQGISEDEEATQLTLEFVHRDQSSAPKVRSRRERKGLGITNVLKTPKRTQQPVDLNRMVNYRALLSILDERKSDDWHLLQLNNDLGRAGCSTITLPAFIMRVDKFERSYKRSLLAGNSYRIEDFIKEAFNGDWHGSVNKDSIWSQF